MKRPEDNVDDLLSAYFRPPLKAEMEASGERVFKRLLEIAPGRIATFNERAANTEKPKPALGNFDQLVLTAVYLCRGQGTVSTITDKMNEISSRNNNFGRVVVTLHDLVDKDLIARTMTTDERPRPIYTITEKGEQVRCLPAQKAAAEAGDFA